MTRADSCGESERALTLAVRDAAARLVATSYEEAAMQGLCGEGALEYALDRLRHARADELLPTDHNDTKA